MERLEFPKKADHIAFEAINAGTTQSILTVAGE